MRARELRGDLSFGEQILDIADDAENDWITAQNGRPIVNKEIQQISTQDFIHCRHGR